MKKILLKSISLVLAIVMIMSCAALAISAVSYVAGTNGASASYKAGKYYSQLSQIPLTGNQRQDVVAVAMSQLQYMESNSSSDLSGTAGGSSNYTEFCYNFGYDIGSNYAWCAAFVTWSLRQAGVNKVGTGSAFMARNNSNYYWCEVSCGFWVSALKTQGYWQGSKGRYGGTYVPKSGDLIFFENGGDSWSDHIGIVVYCDGSTVYTVEGNTSGSSGVVANGGRVAFKSYAIGSTSILGYGAMPYNTSSSGIDYSGANPTPGLYIADGNKYLYTSSSATGSHITLPKGTLLEVTGIQQKQSSLSDSFVLKCKYNGNTYYVSNNTDRIVQITQSGSSSSGGSTGGTSDTSGTIYMGANIDYVGTSSSSYSATNGVATANQSVINVWDFGSASTTSLYLQGWCLIDGGQDDVFKWTADGGTTWNSISANVNPANATSAVQQAAVAISGVASWSSLVPGHSNFNMTVDLSAYAGKTINVTVARQSTKSGNLMSFATVKNIKVPGGSSSGSGSTSGFTSTTAYQQKACIDYINGDLFTSDNEAARHNPVSMACGTQTGDGNLNVSGWCMVNGGQNGVCYSVDGGTTWIECTSASYSNGTDDHKAVAVAGGLTEAYANTTNALFNVNVNLSDYMGQTIDVMFGRIVAANTTLVTHFLTVTGVAVGAGTTSGAAATINGTLSHSNTTTSCPYAYHGCVDSINGLASTNFNSAGLNPYRKVSEATSANHIATATGVTVDSSRTITVAGWLLMRGGQNKYVYSIDGSTWYNCGGTPTTAGSNITTHVENSGYLAGTNGSQIFAANGSFQDANFLKLDLSGCAGHTVDVYVGVVPSSATSSVTQFLTIKSVAVPAYESTAPAPDTTVHTTAAVVNYVNNVGPDGTTETNYANDLIAWKGNYPSIPIANALTGTNTSLTIDGWCIINGGQQNTIKWSVDGGKTWAGTCTVASWSNGSDDHANAAAVWCNMNSISTTGANFSDATADLSAYKGQTISVTFGRMGANGTMYPFLTISEVTVPGCAHSSTSTQTTAATCTTAGSSKVVCNSCGETISTTTIPATGHKAGAAATCTTAQTCTVCGTQLAAASGHSYTTKDTSSTFLKSEATCTSAAVYYYKCANCGGKGTTTYTSGSALAHSYTAQDTSSTYLKSAATCTSAAVYYYKCATCTAKGSTTYTSGDKAAHTYSTTYSKNETSHWYECTACGSQTGAGAHTYKNGSCSVCGYGCSHVGGNEANCTTGQTCTLCGAVLAEALGHNWSTDYTTNETSHWKVCSRCSATTAMAEHTYSGGVCICGFVEPITLPNFNSSVDYVNGVGPDGTANAPYSGMSGNINDGTVSIPFPLSSKTNYVRLQGWALVEGGIIGYKWSIDGVNWNDCSYASLSAAGDEHINASASHGLNSSNTTKDNAIFKGLCADISYYANQTVNVTFAAVATDGTIVPFATITNVKAGTPNSLGASFDSFYVGSTQQNFAGFTGGTIAGVNISNVNAAAGALTATNISAGTSLTLWGWAGYDAPITSFGYYFDGYSSAITTSEALSAEEGVIAAGGQYAKRMKITVSTASLGAGDHTVTFIVKFADGSTKVLATWNISVVAAISTGGTIAGSNSGFANVIILSGQSNAYGASPTDHSGYNIQSKYGSTDFGNIYIHYNNINAAPDNSADGYTWKSLASNAGFEKYRVGIGGENSKRFGPELGIANYLKSAFPNETFYIIKFTAAGTNINGQWFPNDGNGADNWNLVSDMGNYLYPQMANYISESIGMIQAMDTRPVKIHAYAWVQGESDAGTAAMASSYYAYEQLMLNSLRSDFAAYAADGGIAFIDYAISELTYPESFNNGGINYAAGQNVWAFSKALNDSKRANAQYWFDTVNSATENSSYGIGKSILINKTDWMSKWDVGYDSDRWHLSPQSMEALGQAMGVAIHFMDGKSATHVHTEEVITGTAATCTESGMSDGLRCSTCGTILVEQVLIPATGHAFDSDSDAECNNGCGYVRENICEHSYTASAYESDAVNHWNVCALCGQKVNQNSHAYNNDCDQNCNICGYVRETSHVIVTIDATPATCTSTGLTAGERCGVCGYVTVAQTVTAQLGHSYVSEVTAPTCTSRGYTTYTCKNGCEKSYVSDYVDKTGHSYTSEVIAPTCSSRGYTLYTCSCGASYKNNYTASQHNYTSSVTAPTCNDRGYTTYTCTICNYSYKSGYTATVGHTYTETSVAATCTDRGYTLYTCTSCGASHKGNFSAATGHNYTSQVVAPTCAGNGYTLYSCDCGSSYKTAYTAALGHDYHTTTKAATCTEGSYTTYTCSACGAVYVNDYVAPTGHTYVDVTNEAAGTVTHTCSGCGMSYVTKIPTVALTAPADKDTVVLANDGVYQWYNTFDYTTYSTSAYYHDKQNSDIYAPSHVTLEWQPVEGAYAYTISLSTNSNMTDSVSFTVSVTAGAIQNLYVNTTYYWQITALCEDGLCADGGMKSAVYSFTTAMSPRTVLIDGVGNTRDAGGYATSLGTIKQGMIYRGATLDNITAAGKNTMINDLGIKTDLDLRKPAEGTAGTSSPIGVNYININGKYYVATDATGIHSAEGKAAIAQEIRTFADASNYPIYVHCSLGRDRTGTIVMLIQALLGADKDTIMMDYELSLFSSVATQDGAALSIIQANMTSTLDYIENNFEGATFTEKVENYVLSTGVTQEEINTIRALMLETA